MNTLSRAEWVQSAQRKQPIDVKLYNWEAVEGTDVNSRFFNQNNAVKKFNSLVLRKRINQENQALAEMKARRQKLAEDENRKLEEKMHANWKEALRRDQQKVHQRRLENKAFVEYQVRQRREKELLKEKERLEDKKHREYLRNLDELHARDLIYEAEKKVQSQRINHKMLLDDIYRQNLDKEERARKLNIEEQKTKLAQLQSEEMLMQRKAEQAERFRKLQIPKEIVRDKLAATNKQQAATTALWEEQRFAKDVARKEAAMAKQQKEKEEKRAAELHSISAFRQKKIHEKEQKAKAEKQSSFDWLQALKEADQLSITNEKLRVQKVKNDLNKINQFNFSMAAEKRARSLQQLKQEERDAAVRNAEQIEREKHFQQYVQQELHKAVDNTWRQEHQNLTSSHKETNRVDLRPTCLPPISKAAKAKQQETNNLDLRYGETKMIDPPQTWLSCAPAVCKPRRASAAPLYTCLPPIRNSVKHRSNTKLFGPT